MKSIEELEHMDPKELGFLLIRVMENEMDLSYAKRIIEAGAELNQEGTNGLKPIHFATMYSYNDLIKLLVNYGANINDMDDFEMTALHNACNPDTFNQLLKNKIPTSYEYENEYDENEYDDMRDGWSSDEVDDMDVEEYYPGIDTIHLLIVLDADINAFDELGQTPLHRAVISSYINIRIVMLLLASGADISALDGLGRTAWDLASPYFRSSCPELNPNYNG